MKDSSEIIDRVSATVAGRARSVFRWSERTTSPWPEIAVVAVIAALLLYIVRDSWFFGDDWAFLRLRWGLWHDGEWFRAMFQPHNEHLYVTQSLLYLALQSTIGIGSALPYLAFVVAGHVALLWAIRTLLVRLDVPVWGRVVALVWFGVFGAGAENLVWPFQMGFIWSFAFAAWGLLVITKPGAPSLRRDLWGSALFLLGLATTSTAIGPTLVGLVLVAVVTRSIVRVVRIFAVPIGFYSAWYLLYGSSRIADKKPVSLSSIVPYFTRGIQNGLDQTVQFAGLGLVLGLAALVVVAVVRWFDGRQRAATAVLASTLGLFFLLSAIGRGAFGAEQATAIRYVYFVGATMIPVFVLVAVALMRRHPRTIPIVGVLLVVAIAGNAGALVSFRNGRRDMTTDIKWRMAAAALYVDQVLVDSEVKPDPVYTPDITIGRLGGLVADGLWDPGIIITPQMVVDGAAGFGWRVFGAQPPVVTVATRARVESTSDVRASTDGACTIFEPMGALPTLVFAPDSPGAFSIDSGGTAATLRFRSNVDPSAVSKAADLRSVLENGPTWMALYPIGAQAIMTLPADASTTLCGLG